MPEDLILVSNYEEVENDDFYLEEEWLKEECKTKEEIKEIKEMQKEGKLYYGYIVSALTFALHNQMDAQQVIMDKDANVLIDCESQVIDNDFEFKEQYNY